MRRLGLCCSLALLASSPAVADRLELRDGTVLEGSFRGGEERILRFQVDGGELRSLPLSELSSLVFEAPPEPSMRVPAATRLKLRLTEPIGHGHHEGSLFKGVLDEDLVLEGRLVAPAGTPALGRVSSSRDGTRRATLRLTALIIGGRRHLINSDPVALGGPLDVQTVLGFRLSSNFHVLESELGR